MLSNSATSERVKINQSQEYPQPQQHIIVKQNSCEPSPIHQQPQQSEQNYSQFGSQLVRSIDLQRQIALIQRRVLLNETRESQEMSMNQSMTEAQKEDFVDKAIEECLALDSLTRVERSLFLVMGALVRDVRSLKNKMNSQEQASHEMSRQMNQMNQRMQEMSIKVLNVQTAIAILSQDQLQIQQDVRLLKGITNQSAFTFNPRIQQSRTSVRQQMSEGSNEHNPPIYLGSQGFDLKQIVTFSWDLATKIIQIPRQIRLEFLKIICQRTSQKQIINQSIQIFVFAYIKIQNLYEYKQSLHFIIEGIRQFKNYQFRQFSYAPLNLDQDKANYIINKTKLSLRKDRENNENYQFIQKYFQGYFNYFITGGQNFPRCKLAFMQQVKIYLPFLFISDILDLKYPQCALLSFIAAETLHSYTSQPIKSRIIQETIKSIQTSKFSSVTDRIVINGFRDWSFKNIISKLQNDMPISLTIAENRENRENREN